LLRDTWAGRAARRLRLMAQGRISETTGPGGWIGPEAWIAPDPALRAQLARRAEETRESGTSPRPGGSAYEIDIQSRLDDPRTWLRTEETFVLGRRWGVSVLDPFWDADLVDLLARVRPEIRNRGGVSKALVRGALARRFPQLGFENQTKQMLGTFIQTITSREAGRAIRALGDRWTLGELGVIDTGRARAFLAGFPKSKG